ncbi:class I SAM-dependent methyltransferase [Halobacillus shinanisalinarum]|uniref:Class I SAM-dependent methyltransferase n=1 Tax=Halobacillus shinanisalinarum TaxID=2932258 RepID=A0ABY4GU12_9BACI|nr:class I SAM-dependent methyltransferase [Halobacillus shinanisalinarum]UOQ91647.1 class I SAM-dependent methyltransferase [Halobacillus shinanisalinarum]
MSEKMKQRVKETFSKNNEAYVQSKVHNNQSDLDLVTQWLKPNSSWTVLDIATGGGHVARQLSPYVKTVFATDLTEKMLENTASHLTSFDNIHYVIADAEELPFLQSSFDVVTCRIAPHHFPHPDQFISEVQRVLKQGGYFIMIDNIASENNDLDHFYNTLEKMRDPSHVRALKISEWEKLFLKYDLQLKEQLQRKKNLPFSDWLNRTLDNESEKKQVVSFIENAEDHVKSYFAFQKKKGEMIDFSIDEWMVMTVKQ